MRKGEKKKEKGTGIRKGGKKRKRDVHFYHFYSALFREFLACAGRQEKNKRHEKEEVKLSLFVDDMIIYIEKLKEFTKKLVELIHKFSKVTGYNINIQRTIVFLYNSNEKPKIEIRKKIIWGSIKKI